MVDDGRMLTSDRPRVDDLIYWGWFDYWLVRWRYLYFNSEMPQITAEQKTWSCPVVAISKTSSLTSSSSTPSSSTSPPHSPPSPPPLLHFNATWRTLRNPHGKIESEWNIHLGCWRGPFSWLQPEESGRILLVNTTHPTASFAYWALCTAKR